VNLATVPAVRTDVRAATGEAEGFLFGNSVGNGAESRAVPIGANTALVTYLRANAEYNIVQHGFYHELHEIERCQPRQAAQRLETGARILCDAGLSAPKTFVA